jgi:raffinose/stachyose/melibiose transport system permease protein
MEMGMQKKSKSSESIRQRGYYVFLIPGLILFTLVVVLPFLANIYISFTKWQGVGAPIWIGITNYQKALVDSQFWLAFKNNLLLIIAITIIPTIIGLFLSAFLFEYVARHLGKGAVTFFRSAYYIPQIIPVVAAAVTWQWILQPDWGVANYILNIIGLPQFRHDWLGTADTALASIMLMMVWFQIGYPLVIFLAAYQRIDPEIWEAASIDGATWFQRFFLITINQIRPEIYVVVLTTIIHALKVFGQVYVMTSGGPGHATSVASYYSYQNFFEKSNVGYGATVATVLAVVIMAVMVINVRVQQSTEA